MKCKLCQQYPKDWDGSDITCWNDSKEDNLNCRMLSELRELAYIEEDLISYTHHNDQNYLIINGLRDFMYTDAISLYITWYKNRGHTEQVWLMFDRDKPRQPSEDEIMQIIEYFKGEGI